MCPRSGILQTLGREVGGVLVGRSIPGAASCRRAEGHRGAAARHSEPPASSLTPTCGLHTFNPSFLTPIPTGNVLTAPSSAP